MVNKAHPTSVSAKSKPLTTTADNRKVPARSQDGIEKLVALGVPRALADTFPLTPHSTGRWCKKLRTPHGPKIFYFGALADWQGAVDRFHSEKEDLVAGRTPVARNCPLWWSLEALEPGCSARYVPWVNARVVASRETL